jgi:prepilin-type N-terminal cleavage/methylation domain-containing protein
MLGRCVGGRVRARPGLTVLELIIAVAVLGLLGSLVYSCHTAGPGVAAPPCVSESAPPAALESEVASVSEELSLQATLDRMGYTVNVPLEHRGRSLDPRGDRYSTLDDTVDAGWFRVRDDGTGVGTVSLQLISQQTDLDAGTRFVVETADSVEVTSFNPVVPCGFDTTGQRLDWSSTHPVRFLLDVSPTDPRSTSPYPAPEVTELAGCDLMVLPARKNGYWVQQDANTGYWAGGEDTGEYLLCWEDGTESDDCDFQDLVFLARGIVPSIGPVPACGLGIDRR